MSTTIVERFGGSTSTGHVAFSLGRNFKEECYFRSRKSSMSFEKQEHASVIKAWSEEFGSRSLYHQIRDALTLDDPTALREIKHDICALEDAIVTLWREENQSPNYCYTYRGVRANSQCIYENYEVGKTFLWPNFTATSKSKRIAESFSDGGWVFVIDINGAQGINYFADVSRFSKYPGEEEVLFCPYTGFKVLEVDTARRCIRIIPFDSDWVGLFELLGHTPFSP